MGATAAIPAKARTRAEGQALPVTVICLAILIVWYLAAIPMNSVVTAAKIEAAGGGLGNTLHFSWNEARPVIPAPHQIAAELWKSIFTVKPWLPKSLVYHGWVTLSSTLLGFALGALLGIVLAIAIVHVRFLSKSLMPWIIASQTIPILAIAPMVIVVLGSLGFTGLVPKSLISMYLCFFPVTIGMVKGLTSPEPMQLDLMRTYNASLSQVLWKLRFPASVPFLFTSLKVAVAIALTGAIVGELPTGAIAGIGARLLQGSYYGQTVQIWAALFMGSFIAAGLVWLVGAAERITLRRMGARP
ncbi:ABC transporter permease [Aestuariivirga sp.]|uniref:ABC transporter permease n=1 Tax=Aestuariivirga sp. TaxID=2650926 RepID=UPI00391A1D4E